MYRILYLHGIPIVKIALTVMDTFPMRKQKVKSTTTITIITKS